MFRIHRNRLQATALSVVLDFLKNGQNKSPSEIHIWSCYFDGDRICWSLSVPSSSMFMWFCTFIEFSSSPQTARRKHAKTSVTVSNREASKINIRSWARYRAVVLLERRELERRGYLMSDPMEDILGVFCHYMIKALYLWNYINQQRWGFCLWNVEVGVRKITKKWGDKLEVEEMTYGSWL